MPCILYTLDVQFTCMKYFQCVMFLICSYIWFSCMKSRIWKDCAVAVCCCTVVHCSVLLHCAVAVCCCTVVHCMRHGQYMSHDTMSHNIRFSNDSAVTCIIRGLWLWWVMTLMSSDKSWLWWVMTLMSHDESWLWWVMTLMSHVARLSNQFSVVTPSKTYKWVGSQIHMCPTYGRVFTQPVVMVQPIAFGVSFNLNLPSQSPWSLFNGTW